MKFRKLVDVIGIAIILNGFHIITKTLIYYVYVNVNALHLKVCCEIRFHIILTKYVVVNKSTFF